MYKIEFVYKKFVLAFVQIDLIQFENSICIRSICTKTNTFVTYEFDTFNFV